MKKNTALLSFFICIMKLANGQDSTVLQKIICYDGKFAIFPPSWLDKKIKAKATAADTADFRTDVANIEIAFGKYPTTILEQEVRKIYVVGKLHFNGQNFFGTNSRQDIYIASEGNDEIERTFHHEFSSILLRNHPDYSLEKKWKIASPEIMSVSSAEALKKGYNSRRYDTVLLNKGYLNRYSLSNWENDFNMYAEEIFSGGKTFWKIADSYPKVLEKARLVMKFYAEKVTALFAEAYFRALADE